MARRHLPLAAALAASLASGASHAAASAPPERLADTGLYADLASHAVAADVLSYAPQYPLWTDGARKRRWLWLPPGTSIDASDPDHWVFPAGTKLWKEFSFGRRVETRYMERAQDGGWLFATYVWSEDGREAVRAPDRGVPGAIEIRPGVRHDVPSVADCTACHDGPSSPVLGLDALQLSPDRDPSAPHAEAPSPGDVDLASLAAKGLLRGLPPALLATPPRIAARTPRERAVLGYLHGNCAGCHAARGPLASLGMFLEQKAIPPEALRAHAPLASAIGRPSEYEPPGLAPAPLRIAPGAPDASVLAVRMSSRSPLVQMPPLGTHAVDEEALALVRAWIREDLAEPSRRTPSQSVAAHAAPPAEPRSFP